MDYNLLDEDWIPVLTGKGEFRRLGIVAALRQAREIRQLASNNPMDRVALLRFLMALVYWGLGNPREENTPKDGEPFPEKLFEKLEAYRKCFNLLGEGKRFYQTWQSGRDPDRRKAITELIQEMPTGNH
jgi:CRISPR system Cascade subunit CasA